MTERPQQPYQVDQPPETGDMCREICCSSRQTQIYFFHTMRRTSKSGRIEQNRFVLFPMKGQGRRRGGGRSFKQFPHPLILSSRSQRQQESVSPSSSCSEGPYLHTCAVQCLCVFALCVRARCHVSMMRHGVCLGLGCVCVCVCECVCVCVCARARARSLAPGRMCARACAHHECVDKISCSVSEEKVFVTHSLQYYSNPPPTQTRLHRGEGGA